MHSFVVRFDRLAHRYGSTLTKSKRRAVAATLDASQDLNLNLKIDAREFDLRDSTEANWSLAKLAFGVGTIPINSVRTDHPSTDRGNAMSDGGRHL